MLKAEIKKIESEKGVRSTLSRGSSGTGSHKLAPIAGTPSAELSKIQGENGRLRN